MSFFTIPLKIITSGSQKHLGQEVTSEVKIEPISELRPENLPSEIKSIALYYKDEDILVLKATLNSDIRNEKVLDFVADFSDHLTFLINSKEEDPWNGTFFVEPQIQNIHFQNSTSLSINDNLCIKVNITFGFENNDWDKLHLNHLIRLFYYANKARQERDKFFNLFLMLEALEKSTFYKNSFAGDLFTVEEMGRINNLAQTMDKRKRDIILGLQRYTTLNRAQKLCKILNDLGIKKLDYCNVSKDIDNEMITEIITGRNTLFHGSEKLYLRRLWDLFFVCRDLAKFSLDNQDLYL